MKKLLLSALCIFGVGCEQIQPPEWMFIQKNDQVVWSDDSTELAVAVLSYEERPAGLLAVAEQRRFNHQIFAQHRDGSNRRSLTPSRPARSGHIFYMKQAGYLIVESISEEDIRRFDKVDLTGNWIAIVEEKQPYRPCPTSQTNAPIPQVNHQIIPSPDGQFLIEVYSPECGKATIEFLYANNLNFIDSHTFTIDEPMQVFWQPDNQVLMTNFSHKKAWQFGIQTPPIPVFPPRCSPPLTSSSALSSQGEQAYFEGDNLLIKQVGTENSFGCQ